jgi:hypothetical protein
MTKRRRRRNFLPLSNASSALSPDSSSFPNKTLRRGHKLRPCHKLPEEEEEEKKFQRQLCSSKEEG